MYTIIADSNASIEVAHCYSDNDRYDLASRSGAFVAHTHSNYFTLVSVEGFLHLNFLVASVKKSFEGYI